VPVLNPGKLRLSDENRDLTWVPAGTMKCQGFFQGVKRVGEVIGSPFFENTLFEIRPCVSKSDYRVLWVQLLGVKNGDMGTGRVWKWRQ
jgi:hypothetical protein